MAASISISVVTWLILLAFVPIGQMFRCKDTSSRIHQFESDSCVLIQDSEGRVLKNEAEAKCRSFDEYPNQWHLPALKTKAKHDELENILRGLGWKWPVWFWLGVDRYDNDTQGVEWGDLTKWFWTIDNSTVSDTLNIDYPWAARTTGSSCVFVFDRLNATKSNVQWFNVPCVKLENLSAYGTHVVICESKDISTTTSTTSTSSTTTMATSEATTGSTVATTSAMTTLETRTTSVEANSTRGNVTTVSDDPKSSTEKSSGGLSVSAWVAIGLMVLLVLLVSGLVGFCLGKRYQKRRLAKLHIRRCDSDSSASETFKRSKPASFSRSSSASAQSSSHSEEFHDHGQAKGTAPPVATAPKGKQKAAAVGKVLPKGKSQKKADTKSK